ATIILRTNTKGLFVGQILSVDPARDLALLSTNASACIPLDLGSTDHLSLGEEVFAIGNPLGLQGTITRGIISAQRQNDDGVRYVQIDAPLNPGNSGGPLIGTDGK